jgi:hypothetical protein
MLRAIILLALFATGAEASGQDRSPKAKACRVEKNERAPAVWAPIPGLPSNYRQVVNRTEREAVYRQCMKRSQSRQTSKHFSV